MEGFQFLGVFFWGNRSARRKPTKASMELANQIHLMKGKCSSTRPTHLATGVVHHPVTEQNRPYKALPGFEPRDLLHQYHTTLNIDDKKLGCDLIV